MRRVYWRPRRVSQRLVFAIGAIAVGGSVIAERGPFGANADHQTTMLAAANLAAESFRAVRNERLARGHRFTQHFDPAGTGLIGNVMSAATSLPASLKAKQTSVNPNFAAAVVEMLKATGVQPGDRVAVGCTGSFPAFNICVYAAIEALDLRPTIIHSVSSSQFGANDPDMLWLDMEKTLHAKGCISFRSDAATLGGFGDRAAGAASECRDVLQAAISRNGVRQLQFDTLAQSIDRRMQFYRAAADREPIKAYVNVGGGAASIHGSQGKAVLNAGVNDGDLVDLDAVDCVAARFAQSGTPVIHLADAMQLARKYGMPLAPNTLPAVGTGKVYTRGQPNRWIAALVLCGILVTLRICVWTDHWLRIKAYLHNSFPWRRETDTLLNMVAAREAELSV